MLEIVEGTLDQKIAQLLRCKKGEHDQVLETVLEDGIEIGTCLVCHTTVFSRRPLNLYE